MTLDQLQRLYQQRCLLEAYVEPSVDLQSWVVVFRHSEGGVVSLTDGHGIEQRYGDIDLASEQALRVGFHQVRIVDL